MSAAKMQLTKIRFNVNGAERSVSVPPMKRLLDVLREDLGLTGVKEGCGEGECGSCSVLLDGVLVNSCLVPALQANGCEVLTVEGLATNAALAHIQRTFLELGGTQCGICTPGMMLAAESLLRKNPKPDLDEIREGLAGNLCRCTGYMRIFDAVRHASQALTPEAIPAPEDAVRR
ncbi:MAG: (2Fe-2S)-binding protein [Terracidiphilus sp.]|jgi:carbon-monoxide dehydrogenase small subunit